MSSLAASCLVTDKVELPEEDDFPPSIVSAPEASELGLALDQIIRVDQDAAPAEIELPVRFRDPNVDQQLFWSLYVDFEEGDSPLQAVNVLPVESTGEFERQLTVLPTVPFAQIEGTGCHKIELFVTGEFEFNNFRRPVREGDIAQAVWWVATTSAGFPSVNMTECPE